MSPRRASRALGLGTTIGEQTRQALTNVQAILEAAGSSMAKVVSATFTLRNPETSLV
jgi:2-iminobutanoate/2-iminopropanoate deaminase